jgi:hypothetical protein
MLCVITTGVSFGCSLGLQPVRDFDRNEYIFIGEVIGIAGPFETRKFHPQAWGLKIKVTDPVNLPQSPASYFEVIPYELWADCTIKGSSEESLLQDFPTGSKVKIIARRSNLLPHKLNGGHIRLEILPGSLGSISRNYTDESSRPLTSSQSVFDYKAYRRIFPSEYTEAARESLYAQSALPEFEMRKDLQRLRNSTDQDQRIIILERLIYYPECCDLDFDRIIKKYIKNRKARDSLLEKRETWENRDATNTN